MLVFSLFLSWTTAGSVRGWAAAKPPQAPRVVVDAPPELAALAQEVERLAPAGFSAAAEWVGGEREELFAELAPVRVVLLSEGSAAARAVAPWISGYAISGRGPGEIVLLPARADRYPDFGLESVLRHELTHLLVDRRTRGGDLPRWFNEGLAMTVGRSPDWGDSARLMLAVMDDGTLPLARLDAAFAGGESEVHSAYALAGDIVRELMARHGRATAAAILDRVARGERFRAAFLAATGKTLDAFEAGYWGRRTPLERWVPILSNSVLLWGGIAVLAVVAIRRRRTRDRERLARWEAEEGARTRPLDEAPEFDPEPGDPGETWPPVRPPAKRWGRRG